MRRRRPAHRALMAALAGGLLGTALLAVPAGGAAQDAVTLPPLALPTTSEATIPVRDGVTINATVARPVAGTWPAVIIPGTFAGD
jgi:predicted acyl esterase